MKFDENFLSASVHFMKLTIFQYGHCMIVITICSHFVILSDQSLKISSPSCCGLILCLRTMCCYIDIIS